MKLKRFVTSEEDFNFDGDMNLIVKNFKRFLRHAKQQKEEQEKDEEKGSFTPICYLCGKKGHISPNCHIVKKENQKKFKKSQKMQEYLHRMGG